MLFRFTASPNAAPLHCNHQVNPDNPAGTILSEAIRAWEAGHPGVLPNLRMGSRIAVASDYSGDTRARYSVLSIVLGNRDLCGTWEQQRLAVRNRYLNDRGEMSYKDLHDGPRWRALRPFLSAANNIPGLSLTVAIHKDVPSLFDPSGRLTTHDWPLNQLSHWRTTSIEKMLRVVHLISLFLAGLSAEGQNVFWTTDRDAIIPKPEDRGTIGDIWKQVVSFYAPHPLRLDGPYTDDQDDAIYSLRDFLGVPDLVAGAVSDHLTRMKDERRDTLTHLTVPGSPHTPNKARTILRWLSDPNQHLRRLLVKWDFVPAFDATGAIDMVESKHNVHLTNFADYRFFGEPTR